MASSLSLVIISGLIIYLCYLQIKIIKFTKEKLEKSYVGILLLLFISGNFWFFLNVDIRFPLDIIIIIGYACFIFYFWFYNLLNLKVLHREKKISNNDSNFQDTESKKYEVLRKFFHFFIFFGTLLFLFIYNAIMIEVISVAPEFGAEVNNPMWEGIPFIADLNIDYVYDTNLLYPPPIELLMIIFYLIITPFIIILEYFRLNPELGIPMQRLFEKSLRKSEIDNTAHYYYFFLSLFIATVFLPIAGMFAVFCGLTFGDTAASMCGKNINQDRKHCIKWESEKCWEGAIAGFILTIIPAALFVGWILGAILGIIFLIIDITTPEKLKISDNFIFPMLSILILALLIYLFGLEPNGIIGIYFNEVNQWYMDRIPALIY